MAVGVDQDRGLLVSGRFGELENALAARVCELREGRPLAPLTIVVGSAALRTHVGDLLVQRLGAVINVSVITMARLASNLAATATAAPLRPPSALVRERLVRRLVDERRAEPGLRYFGPVSERPHFARALASTFEDLRQACVEPTAAWARTQKPEKAADLEALYATYCAGLVSRGLSDDAAVHLAAAAAAGGAGSEPPSKTILYGVYDLNQAQQELVSVLLTTGADVFVPAPRAGGGGSAPALLAALTAGLTERHLEAPHPRNDLERVAGVVSAGRSPLAAALDLQGDGSLSVVSVPDEQCEVREAVREVLLAAAAGSAGGAPRGEAGVASAGDGVPFRDCAVIVSHADDAERIVAGLEVAGLPVACRRPDRSQGTRVLLRVLDCLAPSAGKPFTRAAVLDLLTVSGPVASSGCAAGARDADAAAPGSGLWADEARRAGVVAGLDEWTERMGRGRRGLERRIEELRTRGDETAGDEAEKAEHLRSRLAAARSLEAAVLCLERASSRLPRQARWADWAGALAELADAVFVDEVAAGLGDAVARLQALAAIDEEVDVGEVAAVLREQLSAARVSEGRVGREGVAVLTPLELRGLRFHTVIFTGLAEGGFPARGRSDPILGDADRGATAAALGVRLPLAEDREAESLLLFALACEAARERLALLAPRTDAATGRPRLPSRLLLRIASLAAGRSVGLDEFLGGAALRPIWRRVSSRIADGRDDAATWVDARERDVAVLLAVGAADEDGATEYLGDILAGEEPTPVDPHAARRRVRGWLSGRSEQPDAYDGLLGETAQEALAARDLFAAEMHPTSLERYIDCPFRYLLCDVFGLRAPEEPDEGLEMDPREFGTLAHDILQRAYSEVIAEGLGADGALNAVARAWEAGCSEAERRGVTGAALAWGARRAALLEDLLETVRRDPVFAAADGRPLLVEWSFGEASGRPVALDLAGGRSVRFAGRVDRVDETPRGARVIDYKTGAGAAAKRNIKARLSVQLPVYGLAVRQTGVDPQGTSRAAVECLYRLVTRHGGFEDLPLEQTEAAATDGLRTLVADVLALVEAGVFSRTTGGRCDYCDVSYACGASAWARARKRRHSGLESVVALQSGPGKAGAAAAGDGAASETGSTGEIDGCA